jgi:hypothetical protein
MTELTRATILASLAGLLAAGEAIIALFFLKFWRRTRDRLFAFFAGAFALLAVQRLALGALNEYSRGSAGLYAFRLVAFLLIIAAIIDKNRGSR